MLLFLNTRKSQVAHAAFSSSIHKKNMNVLLRHKASQIWFGAF